MQFDTVVEHEDVYISHSLSNWDIFYIALNPKVGTYLIANLMRTLALQLCAYNIINEDIQV